MLTGNKAFEMFGVPVPEWYTSLQENKMMAMVTIFFVGNMVESNLLSSGAFEVEVNGKVIWSKLETGHLPTMEHLISLIEDNLNVGSEYVPDLSNLAADNL